MDEYKSISMHLNEALLELDIQKAKNENYPLCVIAFYYKVDLDNTFFFRDLIKRIYELFLYNKVIYNDKNCFLIFLKNRKLHDSVALFSQAKELIKNEFNVSLDKVGITELAKEDTLEDLTKRVNRYLVASKRDLTGKIIYGTREFDYFSDRQREDSLKVLLENEPDVWIYNFYQGIPIKEKGVVVRYEKGKICLKCSKEELLYLKKFESFVYLKHKNFPSIIKGDITNIDVDNNFFCIYNLVFQDLSVVNRGNIRVVPDKTIQVVIEIEKKPIGRGIITNLSVNSIALKVNKETLKKVLMFRKESFVLKFSLFVQDSIALSTIILKGQAIRVDKNEIVFFIKPNDFVKEKIERYIKSIVENIKRKLKKIVISV